MTLGHSGSTAGAQEHWTQGGNALRVGCQPVRETFTPSFTPRATESVRKEVQRKYRQKKPSSWQTWKPGAVRDVSWLNPLWCQFNGFSHLTMAWDVWSIAGLIFSALAVIRYEMMHGRRHVLIQAWQNNTGIKKKWHFNTCCVIKPRQYKYTVL